MTTKLKMSQTLELKIERYYYTSDLCLAAILRINDYALIKCESVEAYGNNVRLVFYFDNQEGILKVVDEYYNSSIESNPYKRFYAELRELKKLIYNS